MERVRNEDEREPLVEVATSDDGDSAVTMLLLFSVFIGVCGSFAYGSAVGYTSPVESQLKNDLALSTAEFSLFGSMLTVGGLLGSLISGKISDLIGRRGTMALSDALCVAGWIVISISEKAWSLDLGRFFVGGGIGITVFVVPIYIAEITPKHLRGGFVSITQFMISTGTLVIFFVGSAINWRLLVLIGILPALVQLFGVLFIPESPRFLAKVGRNKAYESVLQRLRGDGVDVSQEATEIEEFTNCLQQIPEVNFLGLLQRKYAHSLIVVLGLMSLAVLGGTTGLTFYASSVFESAGFSSSIGSIGMAIIQLPSTAIGICLIDKVGRRPLLMFSAAGMSFCCILVGVLFLLKENGCLEKSITYFIVAGLWGYSAAGPLGMSTVPFVLMSEIFPMNAKGSAGSLATCVSGISAWVASYAFNFLMQWSFSGTFFIYAGLNACAVVFVAKLVTETKGETLEQIQEHISLDWLATYVRT